MQAGIRPLLLIGHSGSSAFRLSTTAVSMSLAGSRFSPDSAPRPFHHGFEDEVEQSFGRLAVNVTAGSSGCTNSPHPSSREGHHSHRSVELECPSIGLDAARFLCLLLLWPVLGSSGTRCPSTHMRCMITANRVPGPRSPFSSRGRLAICIAQALSQDHSSTAACSELLRRA